MIKSESKEIYHFTLNFFSSSNEDLINEMVLCTRVNKRLESLVTFLAKNINGEKDESVFSSF